MKKRIIIGILAGTIAMSTLLAGCGENSDGKEATEKSKPTSSWKTSLTINLPKKEEHIC